MTVKFKLPQMEIAGEMSQERFLEVEDDQAEFWDNAGMVREGETRSRRQEQAAEEEEQGEKRIDIVYARSNASYSEREEDAEGDQDQEGDDQGDDQPQATQQSAQPAKRAAKKSAGVTRGDAKGQSNG